MKLSSLHFQNPNPLFRSPMALSSVLRVVCLSPFLQPSRLRHAPSELRFLSSRAPRRSASAVWASQHRDDENGSVPTATDNGSGTEGRVVPAELHKEATGAYMAYAMSVLLGRALPDVRDGLKPVHRRILSVFSYELFMFWVFILLKRLWFISWGLLENLKLEFIWDFFLLIQKE